MTNAIAVDVDRVFQDEIDKVKKIGTIRVSVCQSQFRGEMVDKAYARGIETVGVVSEKAKKGGTQSHSVE